MYSSPEKGVEYQYEKVPINDEVPINNKGPINESEKETEKELVPHGFGVRHFQSLIIFVCLYTIFVVRGHLGVTVVAMVDDTVFLNNKRENHSKEFTNLSNYSNVTDTVIDGSELYNANEAMIYNAEENITKKCKCEETDTFWTVHRKYKWPKPIQDMVLSSFFLGYFLMMFPMGLVCQRWGGKLPLQIALSITGVTSIMTPWLAVWGGWKAVCASRIAQGLCQAGVYPSTTALMASWSPVSERCRLTTYVFTETNVWIGPVVADVLVEEGTGVGTVIAFQVGGVLAASSWGWPSTFWVTGVLSLLAFVMLTVFVSATPHDHKYISEEEKKFIFAGSQNSNSIQKSRTPWSKIVKSKEIWVLFCTHVGSSTAFVFVFTQVPSFLHYTYGVDVRKSGLLSSLPYIGNFLSSLFLGFVLDFCTNRNIISLKTARIISNSLAATGMGLCLTAVSFTNSTTLAATFLVVGLVCYAGIHSGFMVNYIDVAPNYSGILTATGNTLMNVAVLTLPMLVSNIVTDVTNPHQWRIVLFLVAGFNFFTNVVFVAFMTTDVLPWNDPVTTETEEKIGHEPTKKLQN